MHFPKGDFSSDNIPSGNFPKVRLGPLRRRRLQWGQARRLGRTWEVAAWEIAHLGSCHLGKYPWKVNAWEKAFGKVPNIDISNFGYFKDLRHEITKNE